MHDPSHRLRRTLRGLIFLALLFLLGGMLPFSSAQKTEPKDEPKEKAPEFKAPDLALLAGSGASYLLLAPSELLAHPLLKLLPPRQRENLTVLEEEMSRKMGVSFRTLRRFIVVFPFGAMEQPVGLLVSDRAFTVESLQKNLGENWKQEKGDRGPVFRTERNQESLTLVNESLLVIGREREVEIFFTRANRAQPDVTLARGLEAAENGAHFVAAVRPDQLVGAIGLGGAAPARMRPVPPAKKDFPPGPFPKEEFKKDEFRRDLKKGEPSAQLPEAFEVAFQPPGFERNGPPTLAEMLRELPPQALPFKPLLIANAGFIAAKLGEDTALVTLGLGYAKPEQTVDALASLHITLYVAREILPRWWLEEIGLRKETALEVVRSLDRLGEALRKAEIRAAGSSVQATLNLPLDPAIVSTLLREMDVPSFSTERQNNLKQIAIAFHNYEAATGAFPGSAYYSAQGKPLLSWRVAILPYIEEENLFRQFKLDEPWDSPNNIKLLEKMPKIYAPPAGMKVDAGHTFLQGFSGPGTIFDPQSDRKQPNLCQGIRIFAITDGTSNTALVGESGRAVPWTKPEDIPCGGPGVPPLGMVPGSDGFYVALADGSVRTITTRPLPEVFRAFVSRAGGEVLNPEQLDARRGGRGPDVRPVPPGDAPGGPATPPPPPPGPGGPGGPPR